MIEISKSLKDRITKAIDISREEFPELIHNCNKIQVKFDRILITRDGDEIYIQFAYRDTPITEASHQILRSGHLLQIFDFEGKFDLEI